MEKTICHHIKKWAEDNNTINEEQAGFRKFPSIDDQLFLLTKSVKIDLKRKRTRNTHGVFLDLEKAFEKIWVEGLIYKLSSTNINTKYIRWINNHIKKSEMLHRDQRL